MDETMRPWQVGDKMIRRRAIGSQQISLFSALVGDLNPIHSDPFAARAVGFEAPIAHGMVAGSLFSEFLGNELPVPGAFISSNLSSFSRQFTYPVM